MSLGRFAPARDLRRELLHRLAPPLGGANQHQIAIPLFPHFHRRYAGRDIRHADIMPGEIAGARLPPRDNRAFRRAIGRDAVASLAAGDP
jgi:hypothetical protein